MIFELHDANAVDIIAGHVTKVRQSGHKIGLVSGSFDLLHFHHVNTLLQCRRLCDLLVVGVDSDALVRERKGQSRPIIYDSRRAVMVDALRPVDFTFIMQKIEDFGKASELLKPDILFKNNDFAGRENEVLGKEHAGAVIIIRDVADISSTTAIIAAIARTGQG